MLLVQLWINSTRDVWKFAKLDSPRRLVQFWQNFQTSLVLLIPNCTRHRMITYTNSTTFKDFPVLEFFFNSRTFQDFQGPWTPLSNKQSFLLQICIELTVDCKLTMPSLGSTMILFNNDTGRDINGVFSKYDRRSALGRSLMVR
jgi:hypothetical protein